MNYNSDDQRLTALAPGTRKYSPRALRGISEAQVAHPADLWLFEDQWCCHVAYHQVHGTCGHDIYGATFHAGGGDYAFVDGHVRWLTPERFAQITCTNGPLPPGSVGE
jgi:prepilin-type processing-associated H-X9-DG protein